MSLLFRRASDGGNEEQRNIDFMQVWGTGNSDLSIMESSRRALHLVPVYAATGLIADQFAATPMHAYTKDAKTGIATKLKVQPDLLTDPGYDLDLYSWKHQAIVSCLLRGNAYGYILSETGGRPAKVLWLRPDDMWVDQTTDILNPKYFWRGWEVPREQLIHIPAYVQPGSVLGLSPLALFKAQIETGDQAQTFGKNWFKRGGIPSGILKNNARALTAAQAQETKQRFKSSVSAQEPFVTGNDWDYTTITIPGGEAQFISTLKLTANQFAAIYRVAPEDVGGESGGSTLTYKSLEQDMIKFAMRTLRPWTSRFEAVFNKYLPNGVYTKFDLDSSARADLMTRMEAKKLSIEMGIETLTEGRAGEDKPPLTPQEWNDYLTYKAAEKSRVTLTDPAADKTGAPIPKEPAPTATGTPAAAPAVPSKPIPKNGGQSGP